MRIRRLLLAALLPALLLLGGCGDDSSKSADEATDTASATPSESPSSEPTTAEPSDSQPEPQCADVWQDGAKLPGGYEGCYEGERRVKPNGRYCEFGKPLYTYADEFYSVPGGRIHQGTKPLKDDPGYQDAIAKCSA